MGWISKRMMRNRVKWGPPISAEKREAPLRKIAYVISSRQNMFDSDFVRLECGHEVFAYGSDRARCTYCPPRKP